MDEDNFGKKEYWIGIFPIPIVIIIVIWFRSKMFINPVSIIGSISSYLGLFIALYTLYKVDNLEKTLIEKKKDRALDEIYTRISKTYKEHFKPISSPSDGLRGKDLPKLIEQVNDTILGVKTLNNYNGINIDIKEEFNNLEESLSGSEIVANYKTLKNDYEDLMLDIDKVIKKRKGEC